MSYTFSTLEVPQEMFDLVRRKLEEAGYGHAIVESGGEACLDMRGIALVAESCPHQTLRSLAMFDDQARSFCKTCGEIHVGGKPTGKFVEMNRGAHPQA